MPQLNHPPISTLLTCSGKTVVADPHSWHACTIGPYFFATMVLAHVLLVPCNRSAIPSTVSKMFCMGRHHQQLMNQGNTHLLCLFLLRLYPMVVNHLPSQSLPKNGQFRASRKFPLPKCEVPKTEECIHLGDCQKK
mgnify:CR=1 FL=1